MTARGDDRERSIICFKLTHTEKVSTGLAKSLSHIGCLSQFLGGLFRKRTLKRLKVKQI